MNATITVPEQRGLIPRLSEVISAERAKIDQLVTRRQAKSLLISMKLTIHPEEQAESLKAALQAFVSGIGGEIAFAEGAEG